MQLALDNGQQRRMRKNVVKKKGFDFIPWPAELIDWNSFFFRISNWYIPNNKLELENDGNEDGSSSNSDDKHIQPKKAKLILTYQCKVHSIDTALDETNYTPMTLLEELKFTQRIAKEHKICSDKVYEFSNQKRSTIEGASDKQIFWLETRPHCYRQKHTNSNRCIYKFFTNKMIDLILERTNAKIANVLDNAWEELHSRENTAIEICAFIGLFICKGLYKLDHV